MSADRRMNYAPSYCTVLRTVILRRHPLCTWECALPLPSPQPRKEVKGSKRPHWVLGVWHLLLRVELGGLEGTRSPLCVRKHRIPCAVIQPVCLPRPTPPGPAHKTVFSSRVGATVPRWRTSQNELNPLCLSFLTCKMGRMSL